MRYPGVVNGLAKLPNETVIDDEVIALDEHGKPSFNVLQNHASGALVQYFVFDLMILGGKDLRRETLETQRDLLERRVLRKLAELCGGSTNKPFARPRAEYAAAPPPSRRSTA